MPKANNFLINMPLHPYGDSSASIKMNGVELAGVTSITMKANSENITNVSLELECSAAIEMTATFIPSIVKDEELMIQIGHMLKHELPEIVDAGDLGEAFFKVLERLLSDLA